MEDSQAPTVLGDLFYDDPFQLSQALRQRACSDKPFHFTTSTESHHSGNRVPSTLALGHSPDHASLHLPPVALSPFNRALSPRRAATAKHVKPALPKHHSAPTSTGNIKEENWAFKMHQSFNMMDAPGDTQPDSQMLKTWTSGIYTSEGREFNAPKSLFLDHSDDDNGEDLPTDEMDTAASSQDEHMPTPTSPTVVDADEAADAQNSMAPTSPLKFQTPALANRNRGSSSSAMHINTTPATAASPSMFFPAFGNGGDGGLQHISLTQAFNNTQAPTSPAVGGVTEDVVFTRPSPNFSHLRHSSPIPAYSSPIKAIQPDTPKSDPIARSSSEPRADYVTVKQSQERRKNSVGDDHSMSIEQDSWQELSRKVKAQKAKEHAHRRAAGSLSHISVPTPLVPRSGRRGVADVSLPSPLKSKSGRSGVHGESHNDDDDDDDETMDEASQTIAVNGVNEHNTEQYPNDPSQNAIHATRTTVRRNSNDNSVQVPKTSSHPYRTPSGHPSRNSTQQGISSSQLQRESQQHNSEVQQHLREINRPHSSRESVAVMDSQPDATADFDSVPRPKSLRFPSSPSMNQYSINQTTMATKTGYTSQVISSSMPPMPPKSSTDEDKTPDGEERVPSSPPLLRPDDERVEEDDLEYDEHTYDEYAEGVAERDTATPTLDEDTVMEDDDELPLAEQDFEHKASIEHHGEDLDKELDVTEPSKVHPETGRGDPETFEQGQLVEDVRDRYPSQHNEMKRPPKPPSMRRQNTVPETDALDETQPSLFSDKGPTDVAEDGTTAPHDINSTEASHIAQEERFRSESNKLAPVSSRGNESDVIRGDNRIHSIDDIYNLPETQQSAAEDEVEMPRLSGLEDDDDAFVAPISPAPLSTKRRKVTYAARRNAPHSPPKATTDTESLSDPPPSPRLEQIQQALEDTPPTASVLAREDQGAIAATREREAAQAPYKRMTTLKSKVLPKSSRSKKERQGALKTVSREVLQSLSSPANSPAKPKASFGVRKSTPLTPTKHRAIVSDKSADVEMLDADRGPDEPVSSVPHSSNVERPHEDIPQRAVTPPGEVIVPNRVFASWPGSHYYPATCIGRATARQLQIRYDDGNTTSMDTVHVRALDLRRGDHVKVDETGMKKNTYVVVGFKDRIDDLGGEEFPTTDQRGNTTIVLEERPRESLSRGRAMQSAEHISVPMASIYLTAGLWKRLRDRPFNFSPLISPAKSASHIGTPITDPFTTPSFTRRGTAVPSLLKDVTTRAASVASTTRSGSGVFTNMAFVLTSTAADVDKEVVAKQIKSKGGQVLEQGFHELFESEPAEAPTSPQNRRRSASIIEGSVGLVLKQAYKDLGFVALISDSHSRSTKYIQALALNVPCLHMRWIHDSLNASRAAPFMRYLLPAGVSKFLDPNGVVRSRTMTSYDPAGEDLTFAQTIQGRDFLFQDQNVLLVTGKSKKEIEKRQPFVFLSHALGSATVGRCADLGTASDMLTNGKWDWVYVDNGEGGVAEAAATLFGTEKPIASGKTKKGKKRKRDDAEVHEELLVKGEVGGNKIKITCAEFVIQSLILGALIEE
ncbi:hypothetical protein AA0119_g3503 [Alternaria tenuissima]|uniref:BRCT domain-containing protein n=1 Tax=Alternaria tenuissima TaxID=119927 RepID=A0ABY0GL18_9PLEO|nr:hypothetical protein AA0119_g3503 [Alternaria tenuissima]